MNRARARLPGIRPPVRLPIRLGLVLATAALAAACGSSDGLPGDSVATPSPAQSVAPASASAAAPSPTLPAVQPTASQVAPTPSAASPSSAASAACSGNDDNRDFFAAFAEAVAWDVYCPRLPDGWFVDTGTYGMSGGGRIEIVYRGPGGARFGLRQGAFCAEDDGCVPAGSEVGSAAFGDREGTLIAASDGSWALIVDRGATPAWLVTGSALDEATFRAFAEALVLVGG